MQRYSAVKQQLNPPGVQCMNRRNELAGSDFGSLRFRSLGGWVERPVDQQPELEGRVSADVIVVGAGFAGLSTALELTARGAKVIVLEQEFGGFGASGRNAGYLLGSMGIEFELFVRRVGIEHARKFIRFYDEAVCYVERRMIELGIDCDYNPTGVIRAAVHPSQEKWLRKCMEVGRELGSFTRFVDQAEMRARGIPPAFLFGSEQRGGTLHPGKYVSGLRRAALQAGVKLYEKTPLLSYGEGPTITCKTARGSASAPLMVLATNAYTPQLGLLRNNPAAVSEAVGVARLARPRGNHHPAPDHGESPPDGAQHDGVDRQEAELCLNYVYGSKTPNVPDNDAYGALAQTLRERFPNLPDLGIQHCWSGYISAAYDALPVVGVTGAQQNIHYVAGCSGHGLATHSFMGQLLAERINGVENPLLTALHHKTPSMLPEPFQWFALKATFAATRKYDEWTDRKVRKAAATS